MNIDQEERVSALDHFAAQGSREITNYQPVSGAAQQEIFPPSRGAIKVEVKRDLHTLTQDIKQFAAYAGSEWYYRFPVKNNKTGSTNYIEGPSIKLANDLWRIYKNCDVDTRTIDAGDHWIIYARFIDVENGVTMTRPFIQRKNASRLGGDDDGRRMEIAHAIGVSKSVRNVVVNALQTFAEMAFEEAKNSLVEKIGKDLPKWRERTAERAAGYVDLKRVEAVIGRAVNEWLAPDVAKVIAMMKSVTEGFSAIDETFPPLDHGGAANTNTTSALDQFAGDQGDGGKPGNDQTDQAESQSLRDDTGTGEVDAGAGGTTSPPVSPAQIIETLRERLSQATDDETMQEIWDQMDIDSKFMADKIMLDRAKKVLGARKKELRP